MARPEKYTVDYFPFYCQEGKKMFYIEQKYGNDGFAVFIKILRELSLTENHYLNLADDAGTKLFLAAKCRVDENILINVIKDLVNVGKFDRELWEDFSVIWCEDFVNSIAEAYVFRKSKCMNKQNLLLHLQGLPIHLLSKSNVNQDIKPEIRVKYSKLKKSINKKIEQKSSILPVALIPSFEDFEKYGLEKKSDVSAEALNLKYQSWVESGWNDGFGKPIKNWKSKLLNTLPHLKVGLNKNTQPGGSIVNKSNGLSVSL